VVTQVSAVTRALQSFSLELLDEHMAGCMIEGGRQGRSRGRREGA
jgi:DNA-binding FrmR family transcriptional regulator